MQTSKLTFLLLFISMLQSVKSQEQKLNWFPDNTVFPLLQNDLLECTVYSGMFYFQAENENYKGVYVPVNLGIIKPIIQINTNNYLIDINIGAASFTQFEIIQYDQNTLRGGLLNNDYKATAFLGLEKENYLFRLQLFHVSSHLGDDYMIRNEYFERNDKSVNYEQLDATVLQQNKYFDFYAGLGYVITPNAYRERFMLELGLQKNYTLSEKLTLNYASDLKFYHENDFIPNIHSTFGITVNAHSKYQAIFSIDHYFGHIPYSTLKFGKVWWLGPSVQVLF